MIESSSGAYSRREFLIRFVLVTAGAAAGVYAGDKINDAFHPKDPLEIPPEVLKEGQFLAALYAPKGVFVSVNSPISTSVDFTLRRRNEAIMGIEEDIKGVGKDLKDRFRMTEGRFPLFYGPRLNNKIESFFVSPEDIRQKFAAPVFGEGFLIETYSELLGGTFTFETPLIIHHGKNYRGGGVWYALVNYSGKYVNPDGQQLQTNEHPYYLPSAFVRLKDSNS